MTQVILAGVFGLFFGFVLQKSGATNPQRIINMLRLKDFHLMKVILFSIGISSLSLFALSASGVIEANFSIKTAYVGVIVGGLIFGIGWAISGFCPGTSVVALGTGRKDAFVFIGGGLVGTFIFMLIYGSIKDTALFDTLFGGKTTLANTGVEKFPTLIDTIPALYVAGGVALLFIALAFLLPEKTED
ncbi:MAG TPA: hypothetical protein EYH38_10025 [Leucothrix sp.]|nr:hypothetical protein [Leucothrix sp.]